MPNKTIAVTPGTGATINTLPDVGQQAKADSLPVVLASDQGALATTAAQLPSTIGQKVATNSLSVVLASNSDALTTVQKPFGPIGASALGINRTAVNPAAATTSKALPMQTAGTATSLRIRAPDTNTSPVTFRLALNSTDKPVLPISYAPDGTGGTVGDMTFDPGSVEVISLSTAEQTALAAGTLFLSIICPADGAGELITILGNGG